MTGEGNTCYFELTFGLLKQRKPFIDGCKKVPRAKSCFWAGRNVVLAISPEKVENCTLVVLCQKHRNDGANDLIGGKFFSGQDSEGSALKANVEVHL